MLVHILVAGENGYGQLRLRGDCFIAGYKLANRELSGRGVCWIIIATKEECDVVGCSSVLQEYPVEYCVTRTVPYRVRDLRAIVRTKPYETTTSPILGGLGYADYGDGEGVEVRARDNRSKI